MAADPFDPGRRAVLIRAAKAGGLVVAATGLGLAIHDPDGPRPPGVAAPSRLPDFGVGGDGPALAIVRGADRRRTFRRAIESLGGMARFVSPGDRVLLKVNCGFATPPEIGATTHPDLVRDAVTLCREAGAADVVVSDHPVASTRSAFEITGIGAAAQAAGGRVVLPRLDQFTAVTLAGSDLIRDWPVLLGPFAGVNKVIGLCPAKHHARAGATMSMKNWYGLLGGRRHVFHQDINGIIRDLARLVRPTLVVLDGTRTMLRNGPTGGSASDLADTNTLIAGTDQVAVDAAGAGLFGLSPADLPYLGMAAAAGLGTLDFESLRPVRAELGG